MTGVVPLFATLSTGTTPFGDALPATAASSAPSPWSPKVEASDEAARRAELDKIRRDAVEQGRADGMRETEALRATLRQLIGELAQSRDVRAERYAEAIADAAVTAIEAWIGTYDRAALFRPIVRGWIAAAGDGIAIARVNPADTAAMTAAIGDTPIRVEADPKIAVGDVELRGESLDTTHVWRDRLRELRDAIATAIESPAS